MSTKKQIYRVNISHYRPDDWYRRALPKPVHDTMAFSAETPQQAADMALKFYMESMVQHLDGPPKTGIGHAAYVRHWEDDEDGGGHVTREVFWVREVENDEGEVVWPTDEP